MNASGQASCRTNVVLPSPQAGSHFDACCRLITLFLARRSERTANAYNHDLFDFAAFMNKLTQVEAVYELLFSGAGKANLIALSYVSRLKGKRLSPATVNRRLASLRALVKLGRLTGLINWELEIPNEKIVALRDSRGVGLEDIRRLFKATESKSHDIAVRDRAILHLLFDRGLRRAEVVKLDVQDVNIADTSIYVIGKGRTQKERLGLGNKTVEALKEWLVVRGVKSGPLFTNFDHAGKGSRLTGAAVYYIVRNLGRQINLRVRPHALRHSAITIALDQSNGNVRAVQKFSRHLDIKYLMIYDDNRTDMGSDITERLSSALFA